MFVLALLFAKYTQKNGKATTILNFAEIAVANALLKCISHSAEVQEQP